MPDSCMQIWTWKRQNMDASANLHDNDFLYPTESLLVTFMNGILSLSGCDEDVQGSCFKMCQP